MTCETILDLARGELGACEAPAGSNCVKYNTAYYGWSVRGDAYPWCCVFLWWLFRQGGGSALFYGGGKTASCSALAAYAKKNGLWLTEGCRPGDLVFLRFSGSAIQHIGLVEAVAGDGTLTTIEGNTGAGNDANGGQVQRRTRAKKYAVGYYRPRYEEETNMVKTQVVQQTIYETAADVPDTFRSVISALMQAGILQGGGDGTINLTHEQVRTLTLVYRGGGFDAKLAAAGLPRAVE